MKKMICLVAVLVFAFANIFAIPLNQFRMETIMDGCLSTDTLLVLQMKVIN